MVPSYRLRPGGEANLGHHLPGVRLVARDRARDTGQKRGTNSVQRCHSASRLLGCRVPLGGGAARVPQVETSGQEAGVNRFRITLTLAGKLARWAVCRLAGHRWRTSGWHSLPHEAGSRMRLMHCSRCNAQQTKLLKADGRLVQ
jgi:hypothetical protein